MQINPPFGYRALTPFLRDQRVILPKPGQLPAFAKDANALPITFSELPQACHSFPVVFTSHDEGKTYGMVGVMGLTAGENLFLENGGWKPGTYAPAYLRRYPFCMTRVRVDNVEQSQRIICVESECLGEEGYSYFDAAGNPVPEWKDIEQFLHEFELDVDRTQEMCSILANFNLLEHFTAQATMTGGGSYELHGMFRVDPKRLEYLTANDLKTLLRKGIMGNIFIHLASINRFNSLLERKAELTARADTAAANQPAVAEGAVA